MSTDVELVISLLRAYIRHQPEHDCGLCSWLSMETDDSINAYQLVDLVRRSGMTSFTRGVYIESTEGPTPRRVQFAGELLCLLEVGRLKFDGFYWEFES